MYWVRGYFLLGLTICATIFSARVIHYQLNTNADYLIVFDSLLSQDLQERIHTSINDSWKMEPSALCAEIKKQFPMIKDIVYQCKHKKKVIFKVYTYRPIFVLNNTSVLLESGVIEDKKSYIDSCINDLYHIALNYCQNNMCTASCISWLDQNAFTIFDYFNVQWVDATTIVLSDKNSSDFKVLCDEQTKICHTLVKSCFQLKNTLKKTAPIIRGQHYWVADIRFDNQIVLYCKRGKYEGYNVFS